MPKNAIVVGMPRSGTSLSAAVFARKGYYLGPSEKRSVRHGDDHNPFGYFEADDLIEANVDVFRAAGYHAHNTWLFEPISDAAAARILELEPTAEHREFVARHERRSPWLWKDPRLCFTIAYWWRLLDSQQTRVLYVERDPEQIYLSFRRMNWCDAGAEARQTVLRRIDQHTAAARSALDRFEIPHLRVSYSEYLEQPADMARRLSEYFELELESGDLNIRPDLDHSSGHGRLAGWLRALASRLPRRPVRALERLIPRRVLAMVFPERKYVSEGDQDDRR